MMLTRFVPPIFRSQSASSRRVDTLTRADGRFAIAASVCLVLFLIFGGSGAPHPLMLLPLEMLGLAALGGVLHYHLFHRRIRIGVWPVGIVLIGGLALGWLQLLPIPWEIWRGLPGRDLAAAAIAEAGLAGHWRPLSLAPAYTLSALLTVLPAVAMFLFAAAMAVEQRLQLLRIILAVALASAALGLLQVLAPGTRALYLSPRAIFDLSSGIFANRNFQATFLLVAIVLTVTISRIAGTSRNKTSFVGWTIGIIAFLAALVLATQSRFGLLGLVVVLAIGSVALGLVQPPGRTGEARPAGLTVAGRTVPGWVLGLVLAAGIAFGILMFQGVFSRFSIGPTEDSVGELRATAVPDVMAALSAYFPFGTGLGTFDPVYRSMESLELVSPAFFNHAHDDYLELVIELGVVGIVLPALLLVALAGAARTAWLRPKSDLRRILMLGALGGLALILLHSVVDYPLRTVTIQCVFAVLCAIVFLPDGAVATDASARLARPSSARWPAAIAIAAAVIAGSVVIARTQLARQAAQVRAGGVAYLADPGNPRGTALYAEAMLLAGQPARAADLATQAIAASPIDAVALRVLGMARNATKPGSGDQAMLLAARLGWREGQTQSWMVERALLAGRWRVAAMRAEALARLGRDKTVTYGFLAILTTQEEARRHLLASLAASPSWRRHFLTNDDARTIEQRRGMAQLLLGLARTANPPTLAEARPTIDGLLRENDPMAGLLYRTVVPQRSGGRANLLWDGGFTLAPKDYQPGPHNTMFDWRTYDNGGAFGTVERTGEGRNQALSLGGAFGDNGRLAEKTLALAPGRYRVTWRARRDNDDDARGLVLGAQCQSGAQLAVARLGDRLGDEWTGGMLEFTVPPAGCGYQVLSFAARDVAAGAEPIVYVDDVVLQRVDR